MTIDTTAGRTGGGCGDDAERARLPAGARNKRRVALENLPRSTCFRDYVRSRRFGSGRGWKSGWPFVLLALGDEDILSAATWPELRDAMLRLGRDDLLKGAHDVWRRYIQWVREARRTDAYPHQGWPSPCSKRVEASEQEK